MNSIVRRQGDLKPLFDSLQDMDKVIMYCLAVNTGGLRREDLVNFIGNFSFKKFNLSSSSKEIISRTDNLLKNGLIVGDGQELFCANEIKEVVIIETLESSLFESIARQLQGQMSSEEKVKGMKYKSFHQGLLDLRISVFCNYPIENITKKIFDIFKEFPEDCRSNNPLFLLLDNPFSPELLQYLEPFNRVLLLGMMICQAEEELTPIDHVLDYWYGLYLQGEFEIIAKDLLSALLIRGRLKEIDFIIENEKENEKILPSSYRCTYRGCLFFLRGKTEEAISYFEKGIAKLNRDSDKIDKIPQGYPGLFYLLALLKDGSIKRLKTGLDYLEFIAKSKDRRNYNFYHNVREAFLDQLGLPTENGQNSSARITNIPLNQMLPGRYRSLVDEFFFILTLWWVDRREARLNRVNLEKIQEKATRGNYLWLAAEASELLADFDHSRLEDKKFARQIHNKLGSVSIVDMIQETPKWKKSLKSLLNIDSVIEKEKKSKPKRLVWWFRYHDHEKSCSLQPRLQKLIKSGKWSKGSPVSLKQLYTESHSIEGLSEQDLKICRTISEVEKSENNWNYYGSHTSYRFNYKETLPAIIGHPLIFLEDSPEVRVELVPGEPEVQARKTESGIVLNIEPSLPSNSSADIQLIKDNPTRYKVVCFNKEQRYIQKIIADGITFPEEASPQLQEVLSSISNSVTIQSDLGYIGRGEIREVETDSRPHIQLIPYREGLKLEILVKPIARANAWFRPGEDGLNIMAEVDNFRVQTRRNLEKEKFLTNQLLDNCPTLNKKINEFISAGEAIVENPEECLEILQELKEQKEDVVLEWPEGEKFRLRNKIISSDFSLHIRKDRNWFKATGSLEIDEDYSLELNELMDRLDRTKGRFIPLDDGSFLALTKEFRNRLEEIKVYSSKSGKGLKFHPLTAPALNSLTSELGNFTSDIFWQEHINKFQEIIEPDLPENFHAELRDYQEIGFKWLAQLSHWGVGGCLADDMGLGKTIQALAAILLNAPKGPTLVVAPLSVINNWKDEANRFTPSLNVKIFGPGDRQQLLDGLQPLDLVLVSYGLLQVEVKRLEKINWQTVILDEAQVIKNRLTKRSRAAMALQAEFKVITTGTPIENHPGEMWTLFNFINPGLLGSYKNFHENFTLPIERDNDKKASEQLRKLIQPFILRRIKNEVLQELPPRTDITLEVEMSKQEANLYAAQRRSALENINDHNGENRHFRILTEITRLRRLCCNPSLVWPETSIAGSKLKVFGDVLQELLDNNHKVLVFSQFVDHLKIIRRYLEDLDIKYQYLDGSTSAQQREKSIKDFQAGKGSVFLISLRAGGFGLNLSAADYVIHMDPWWNPAVEDQASDRAHRLGQKRPVTVYRLVMKNSIEEQIVDLHAKKRELADSLLEGSDLTGRISTEQLLELLKE